MTTSSSAHPQVQAPFRDRSTTAIVSARRVLFALTLLVYLGTTGVLPLLGRDEPRYVQIGREMLESGDWITPHLGGHTWFEKPVLLYWMVAASFGVFGASEWAARLGPALCGLGAAALLWWMARRTGEQRTGEKTATWSALGLATSGGMLAFAHGATFDIVLTFCVTLALAAWWKAQEASEPMLVRRLLALFWAGVGLAFLAKGLVAFVLTLGTIGLYAALRRQRVMLGLWWGLPLSLLVSAVWYGPVLHANPGTFFNEFFVQHQFQRFTSNKFRHHQPPWFYLQMLPLLTLPWTPFLILALAKLRADWGADTAEARLRAFGLAWLIVPVAFFSLSGSKLPSYILPALPGAFLLVGSYLAQWTGTARKARFAGALAGATLVLTALVTTVGPGLKRADDSSVRELFRVAHAENLAGLRVAQYQTTQRTAEFYAASHLLYDKSGEPVSLDTPAAVAQLAHAEPLLLLVGRDKLAALHSPAFAFRKIAGSRKTWLLLVSPNP